MTSTTTNQETTRRDLAGQLLFPWAGTYCQGCGRVLVHPRSVKRRMGPCCWKKKRATENTETTETKR